MLPRRAVFVRTLLTASAGCAVLLVASALLARSDPNEGDENVSAEALVQQNAKRMMAQGRHTFRHDTFGDEAFWGDTLQLHLAIAGAKQGGVGPGVSPAAALAVGLRVDVNALPDALRSGLAHGTVDLNSPATTLALLQLNAVVGVTGFFDKTGHIASMGIQCALCHSTVDNSFAPGIGRRLDGWANRDLNVGAIIALAPDLSVPARLLGVDQPTVRTVLNSWGRGNSMLSCFWMANLSSLTVNPRRYLFRLLSDLPVSISAPGLASVPPPIGTRWWRTWRCMARESFTTQGWAILSNILWP